MPSISDRDRAAAYAIAKAIGRALAQMHNAGVIRMPGATSAVRPDALDEVAQKVVDAGLEVLENFELAAPADNAL